MGVWEELIRDLALIIFSVGIGAVVSYFSSRATANRERDQARKDRIEFKRQDLLLGNLESLRDDVRSIQRSTSVILNTNFDELLKGPSMESRFVFDDDPAAKVEQRRQEQSNVERRRRQLQGLLDDMEAKVENISSTISRLEPHPSAWKIVQLAQKLRDEYRAAFNLRLGAASVRRENRDVRTDLDLKAMKSILGSDFMGNDGIPRLVKEINGQCLLLIRRMLDIPANLGDREEDGGAEQQVAGHENATQRGDQLPGSDEAINDECLVSDDSLQDGSTAQPGMAGRAQDE